VLYLACRRAALLLARLLYRVEIVGPRPPNPCILAANHESMLDPPLLSLVAEQPLRFLAKEELWRWRLGAWLMDALGGIPVTRGRAGHLAIDRAERLLRAGESVAIFPQGAVRGGAWTRGAARLSLATGVPLVPVHIIGTGRALSPGHFGFPRIRLVVGEPIPVVAPHRPTISAARDLTKLLEDRVAGL
jgi:1-acyl-sn-glycerol-3-phosphate acyltransferase